MALEIAVLVQKKDSPSVELTARALELAGAGMVQRVERPPLPKLALSPQTLVVWDLHGFAGQYLEAMAGEMAVEEAGVVVLCPQVDRGCRAALAASGALALASPGQQAQALAVTLDLAQAQHERLCALLAQREELRQALADRRLVEKAKRLLMEALDVGEAEAMRRLQRQARNSNQKLGTVAQRLIAGYQVFRGDGEEEG